MEFSGEILDLVPNAKVTIVNSGDKLMSNTNLGEKFKDDGLRVVESRGIEVKCG